MYDLEVGTCIVASARTASACASVDSLMTVSGDASKSRGMGVKPWPSVQGFIMIRFSSVRCGLVLLVWFGPVLFLVGQVDVTLRVVSIPMG